jgi:3'-phosphoadenosine 5'-phosphosulfate sulfotransferase (PAPS reductase)/FAD synthetase
MTSPFRLHEPCIVGCSGGRTSGYHLRRVLDEYGGELPPTVRVCFANTGKEREETLVFVDRISKEWGVEIAWLEYRSEYPKHGFALVDFETASRNGQPFDEMLDHKARFRRETKGDPPVLPNPAQRMCTGQLKMNTIKRFAYAAFGIDRPSHYNVALSLRHDEPHRIEKAMARGNECGVPCFPLDDARIVAADVLAFWKRQSFDLEIKSYQGNCDLCFMKKPDRIDRILRAEPERADWWIQREKRTGKTFRQDRMNYTGMLWQSKHQALLPFPEVPDIEETVGCDGGYCSD